MYSRNSASRDGRQKRDSGGPAKRTSRSSSTTGNSKSYSKGQSSTGTRSEKPFRSSDKPERGGFRSREEGTDKFSRSNKPTDDRGGSSFKPKRSFGAGADKPYGDRPRTDKPYADRQGSDRPYRDKPYGDHQQSDKPYKAVVRKKTDAGDSSDDRPYTRPRPASAEHSTGNRPYSGRPRTSSSDRPQGERSSYPQRTMRPRRPVNKNTQAQKNDDGRVRLNKLIASSGICSRREADDLIAAGLVTVNGEIITELGTKVSPDEDIRYNGERLRQERLVYMVMNKPKDYVTTVKDPHAKRTVMELIAGACKERVFPVGRLDRNTTGVLLLTNDGDLTKKLTHPGHNRKKIYHVHLDKNLKQADYEALTVGFELEDGFIKADTVQYVDIDDKKQIGIEIHSGQNRIVRRMLEHLGYNVIKLDRVYFCGLTKKGLQRGHWRFLTPQEVGMLKMGSYE